MFRKIHSNRDPKATLYSEIRREFGAYFTKTSHQLQTILQTYPRSFYAGMVLLLVISGVWSFTLYTQPTIKKVPAIISSGKMPQPALNDGFSRILATGAALQQTLHLKKEVEHWLSKNKITAADSLALEKALDSLQQIHHQINSSP